MIQNPIYEYLYTIQSQVNQIDQCKLEQKKSKVVEQKEKLQKQQSEERKDPKVLSSLRNNLSMHEYNYKLFTNFKTNIDLLEEALNVSKQLLHRIYATDCHHILKDFDLQIFANSKLDDIAESCKRKRDENNLLNLYNEKLKEIKDEFDSVPDGFENVQVKEEENSEKDLVKQGSVANSNQHLDDDMGTQSHLKESPKSSFSEHDTESTLAYSVTHSAQLPNHRHPPTKQTNSKQPTDFQKNDNNKKSMIINQPNTVKNPRGYYSTVGLMIWCVFILIVDLNGKSNTNLYINRSMLQVNNDAIHNLNTDQLSLETKDNSNDSNVQIYQDNQNADEEVNNTSLLDMKNNYIHNQYLNKDQVQLKSYQNKIDSSNNNNSIENEINEFQQPIERYNHNAETQDNQPPAQQVFNYQNHQNINSTDLPDNQRKKGYSILRNTIQIRCRNKIQYSNTYLESPTNDLINQNKELKYDAPKFQQNGENPCADMSDCPFNIIKHADKEWEYSNLSTIQVQEGLINLNMNLINLVKFEVSKSDLVMQGGSDFQDFERQLNYQKFSKLAKGQFLQLGYLFDGKLVEIIASVKDIKVQRID